MATETSGTPAKKTAKRSTSGGTRATRKTSSGTRGSSESSDSRALGALSVAVLWLGSTTWHAMHQRTASLPPTEDSCATAGNASSANANAIGIVLRICFALRRRSP